MSFKEFIETNKIDEATTYYAEELNRLLPADEYGISFQFSSNKGKTKWITLNDESRLALIDFLQKSKEIVKEAEEKSLDGKNGYIAFYKGKQIEVYANSSYEAQKKAAEQFKAKKAWEVTVKLAEKDGEQVTHKPVD